MSDPTSHLKDGSHRAELNNICCARWLLPSQPRRPPCRRRRCFLLQIRQELKAVTAGLRAARRRRGPGRRGSLLLQGAVGVRTRASSGSFGMGATSGSAAPQSGGASRTSDACLTRRRTSARCASAACHTTRRIFTRHATHQCAATTCPRWKLETTAEQSRRRRPPLRRRPSQLASPPVSRSTWIVAIRRRGSAWVRPSGRLREQLAISAATHAAKASAATSPWSRRPAASLGRTSAVAP
ncbi:unnamed protein product [Urochloa humidicola]